MTKEHIIGLTIYFWDYVNIVKEYSKEVQQVSILLKNKQQEAYNNPLYTTGYIVIDINSEKFDPLVKYLKTNKLSKKLKDIILEDIKNSFR